LSLDMERPVRTASALSCLALIGATAVGGCEPGPPEPRPAEEYLELAPSGAWCWFGDPRAVRFQGAHDRIYAGWVDSAGSIVVASLDLETGDRAEHTVHPAFNRDDHANPSLMVLPDGTVVVFYTSHGSAVADAMYYRLSRQPRTSPPGASGVRSGRTPKVPEVTPTQTRSNSPMKADASTSSGAAATSNPASATPTTWSPGRPHGH
jgi:hypothetical protein